MKTTLISKHERLLANKVPDSSQRSVASRDETLFPIDCLPSSVRKFVEEAAVTVGVPVEMVALPVLIAAGATVGRQRTLRLKAGFEVLPVLFAAVVAPPGCGKSPAQEAALQPLRHLQRQAMERYQSELERFEASMATSGARSAPPRLDHLYTSDATMEAIAPMLAASPGLLVHYDELVAWVRACDQYRSGRGADRQHWLSLWSSSPIKVDRKSAETIYVPRPAVSVLGGVQPDLLPTLHNPDGARDGFVERILWVVPKAEPPPWTEETIASTTRDAVANVFAGLRLAPLSDPFVVQLSPEARERWVVWHDENQASLEALDGLEEGFAAKLPVQVARLALILHALDDPFCGRSNLAWETMANAIALSEYFRGQFRLVEPLIAGGQQAPIKKLKSTIMENFGDGQPRTRGDLHRALSGNVRATALSHALEELASEGKLMRRSEASTGGRPAETWWVPDAPESDWLSGLDPDEPVF